MTKFIIYICANYSYIAFHLYILTSQLLHHFSSNYPSITIVCTKGTYWILLYLPIRSSQLHLLACTISARSALFMSIPVMKHYKYQSFIHQCIAFLITCAILVVFSCKKSDTVSESVWPWSGRGYIGFLFHRSCPGSPQLLCDVVSGKGSKLQSSARARNPIHLENQNGHGGERGYWISIP